MNIEVDKEEYRKQLKQEILDSGHYFRLELIYPKVGFKEMLFGANPIAEQEIHNCSEVTIAMAIITLDFIKKELLENQSTRETYEELSKHIKTRDIKTFEKYSEEEE